MIHRNSSYANFAVAEPPLKLVLIQGAGSAEGADAAPTALDHLGVEVETAEQVTAAAARLSVAGLATFEENDTSCCYAVQDKVWVSGPGREPWEVYVVKGDGDTLGKGDVLALVDADGDAAGAGACCGTVACCTPAEMAVDPGLSAEQAKAAAACDCVAVAADH
ncbi:MAG: ArsI/CadI family heavy metal resistance metalloenzyme [Actinocrinis sp.]